jgi:hypothetical protein
MVPGPIIFNTKPIVSKCQSTPSAFPGAQINVEADVSTANPALCPLEMDLPAGSPRPRSTSNEYGLPI